MLHHSDAALSAQRRSRMFLNLMIKLFTRFQLFFYRKDGASAIEYAILIAIVSLVIVTAGSALGPQITNVFSKITAQLTGT